MTITPEALRDAARHMVETVPQASALGFKLISVEPSRGSIFTPWREELVGDPDTGVIAGGVITARATGRTGSTKKSPGGQ